ncbi:MAG: M23 family metallopeptidase, partial [Alistipes sp.]
AQRNVDDIRHRDNHVYRSLFSSDTLAIEGIYTPYSDAKYEHMATDEYAPLMTHTWLQMDALARELYLESVSFDELQALAKDKGQMSTAIPAIWPIDRAKLHNNHLGAFNPRRMHPILHRIAPHTGVDFGCDRGTPVYATGDATVATVGVFGGYGQQILLNHKFGYKTRYAHLDRIFVKAGERVVRGQTIGAVGSTGRSTSPHLHYEVILRNVPVNPVNYFNRKMTNKEYDELMKGMHETNYEIL